jgi:hypothetical protein
VKQLHLISEDDSLIDAAIQDFVRCRIEKARLSEEGNVTDADWLIFEESLMRRWRVISARVQRMSRNQSEEDLGFEVYTETTEEYRERLAGSDTDHVYLTSGSYHLLSNLIRLGWHPRYAELLKPSL